MKLISYFCILLTVSLLIVPYSHAQVSHEQIYDVSWHPNSQTLAIANETGITLYDANLNSVGQLNLGGDVIEWNSNGSQLAAIGQLRIIIFDMSTGQQLLTIDRDSLNFASDWHLINNQLAVADYDSVQIWNTQNGQILKDLQTPTNNFGINSIAWHPNGLFLAVASNDLFLRIWDTTTDQVVATINQTTAALSIAWSPNGNQIAIADGKDVKIYNTTTLQLNETLTGHTSDIRKIEWVSAGLVSISYDQTIRTWNTTSGETIKTISSSEILDSMALNSDGSQLAYWDVTSNLYFVNPFEINCFNTVQGTNP